MTDPRASIPSLAIPPGPVIGPRPGRGLVRLEPKLGAGRADLIGFLDRLLTNPFPPEASAWFGCLLTPQGRVLFDLILTPSGDEGLSLEADRDRLDDLVRRLTLYRLRAPLTIAATPEPVVVAGWGLEPKAAMAAGFVPDPRCDSGAAWRWYGMPAALPAAIEAVGARLDPDAVELYRLQALIPEGAGDLPPEKVLPLDAGLDRLGGIGWQKGCYVGQEVTARMHFKARATRRLCLVAGAPGAALPPPGTALEVQDQESGWIGSGLSAAEGGWALVVVKLDHAVVGAVLSAAGQTVTVQAVR